MWRGWVTSALPGCIDWRCLLDTEVAVLSGPLSRSLSEVLSGDINWRAARLDEITLGQKMDGEGRR